MNKEVKLITEGVKEVTATTYINSYKRIRQALGITDKRKLVKSVGLDKVAEVLLDTKLNANARMGMHTIAKKIFFTDKDKEQIDKIDEQIRKHRRALQVKNNKELKKELPSYKELVSALKKVEDARTYIINYIFVYINARNADLGLLIIHRSDDDNHIDIDSLDKNHNHLVLKDGKATLRRNFYKTIKTYGAKTNKIISRQFIAKVTEFLGNETEKLLLSTKTGGVVSTASYGAYLKKHRLLGLTEAQIMKINMREVADKGSYNLLRKISYNRGTSISGMLQDYDITNIKDIK